MSSSRGKLVSSPSSRGARAESGQQSGRPRQQHSSLSQRSLYSEAQEQNSRLRVLNATLRNQNMDLAKELNDVKSMLRISRQNERDLERRIVQRKASIPASARGRRLVTARSHSTDARPRRAAQRTPPGERGKPQGGCAGRVGVSKDPRGAEVSQTHQSRGGSRSPSCRGEDSDNFVDKNTDHRPLGTSQAWLGSRALVRPVVVAPVTFRPPPGSPDVKEVHRVPKDAPAVRKGRRRCSIVPNTALVNLLSSPQSATPATSALAGPAAERISVAQIQRTPHRGSSRLPDDTAVRNRDDARADARGCRKDGAFLVNTAKEVFTEPDHKTSPTTPTLVEYKCCLPDTRTDLPQHAEAEADNSSYYSRPLGQMVSPSGYSQAVTGAASPSQLMSASGYSQAATVGASPSELISASGYSPGASGAASSSQSISANGNAHSTAEGEASRVKGREIRCLQARAEYVGALSFDTARSEGGQNKYLPWLPSASSSQPTSPEETPQLSTNSRPRRGVARPVSYQEPSLSSKMRNYRGHVMFPTAKARAARPKSPEGAAGEVGKENGEDSDYNGCIKKP